MSSRSPGCSVPSSIDRFRASAIWKYSGMGLLRWRQADRAMRRGDPLPRHPTPAYLAVGLSVVGLVALGLVIAKAVIG